MSEAMQPRIFPFAKSGGDGASKATVDDIGVAVGFPRCGSKHEIAIRLEPCCQLPFLQRVGNKRPERNLAPTRCRFRVADFVEAVGTLSHLQFVCVQINIAPSQSPKLGNAKAATIIRGRAWPLAAAIIFPTSWTEGISTPTSDLRSALSVRFRF